MTVVLFEIVIIFLLVLLNGFFAMSELAVVSSRKGRLKQMANEGSRGARAAITLAEDPGRFLPTVQIGITLIGVLAGAFAEPPSPRRSRAGWQICPCSAGSPRVSGSPSS